MSSLPEEIYLDILLRVPVKSTFVCKCVCKSWFSLISDPDFVKSHLNRTTQTNNYHLILKSYDMISVYSVSYDSLSSWNGSESDGIAVVVRLDAPYKSSKYRTELLGSCNGLVYGWNDRIKSFLLWNPATKEYKRLPKLQDTYSKYLNGYHGFGYDHKTNDYKLVKIYGRWKSTLVQVYSLKSNSWKTLQSCRYEVHSPQASGVLFNGALHWFGYIIGEMSSELRVVLMYINEERFEELQLPLTQYNMNMGVLGECLCVLANFKEKFDAWIMQDHGVPESWAKIYSITCESIRCDSCCNATLIGSFMAGEILFWCEGQVISYGFTKLYYCCGKTEKERNH